MKMYPLNRVAVLCASLFLIIFESTTVVGNIEASNKLGYSNINGARDKNNHNNHVRNNKKIDSNIKLSKEMAAAKKVCWGAPNLRLLSHRIVNGSDPERTSEPWMVALFKEKKGLYVDTVFMCGGALISAKFVLTAAHCYVNDSGHFSVPKASMLSVRYGMHDLSSKIYSESKVSAVFAHPNYKKKPDEMKNDLALLKLKAKIEYREIVQPICVPYLTTPSMWNKLKKGRSVLVSGWGRTAPAVEARANVNLQKGIAYIEKNSVCSKKFDNYDQTTTVCIGSQKNASKVCHGDSGSPVIPYVFLPKNDSMIFHVVIGLVSFGDDQCRGPDILTKVECFIKWINKITSK